MHAITLASTILTLAALGPTIFAATISGKVVDIANRPVAAAIVKISEEPTSPSVPSAMHGGTTRTAADGTFSVDNLEAGTYLLCAQVLKGTLINPCQWTTTLPHATLASAAAITSITLTMRPGYRLPIRVDDTQGLLNAHEGKTPGAHLLIGVHGGYHFEPADTDSADSSGRNLSVLVPFDVPVGVTVQSGFFKVQDAGGNAIKNAALPATVNSAAPSSRLTIKITGKN